MKKVGSATLRPVLIDVVNGAVHVDNALATNIDTAIRAKGVGRRIVDALVAVTGMTQAAEAVMYRSRLRVPAVIPIIGSHPLDILIIIVWDAYRSLAKRAHR